MGDPGLRYIALGAPSAVLFKEIPFQPDDAVESFEIGNRGHKMAINPEAKGMATFLNTGKEKVLILCESADTRQSIKALIEAEVLQGDGIVGLDEVKKQLPTIAADSSVTIIRIGENQTTAINFGGGLVGEQVLFEEPELGNDGVNIVKPYGGGVEEIGLGGGATDKYPRVYTRDAGALRQGSGGGDLLTGLAKTFGENVRESQEISPGDVVVTLTSACRKSGTANPIVAFVNRG